MHLALIIPFFAMCVISLQVRTVEQHANQAFVIAFAKPLKKRGCKMPSKQVFFSHQRVFVPIAFCPETEEIPVTLWAEIVKKKRGLKVGKYPNLLQSSKACTLFPTTSHTQRVTNSLVDSVHQPLKHMTVKFDFLVPFPAFLLSSKDILKLLSR